MTTATKAKAGITLDAATLRTALSDVNKAVGNRSPKPILHNVKLGDGLLTATDLEVMIQREIDYHGDPILFPAAKLKQILGAANGDTVTLTPQGTSVKVRCGTGSWVLPTEDAAEFPAWQPSGLRAICRLPADQFARAARATAYATDADSSRYALGGVLLDVEPTRTGSRHNWVATDGRRMAWVKTESEQALDAAKTLVPARAIEIASGMAHGNGSIEVEANASEVRFTMDGVTITARLVDGKFPSWREVVGELEGEPTVLEVADLLRAVESAAIVTSEQSKGVDFAWAGETLTLKSRSAEYGESTVKCDVVAAGSASATKLDPRYVVQFLSHIPSDEEPQVDVYAKDPASRVLLRCGPYTGVIMPLSAEG